MRPLITYTGILSALLSLLFWVPPDARAERPSEYQLKAIFLYKLSHFVTWPESAFPSSDAPLIIGIVGKDPFGKIIDQVVTGVKAQDRDVEIHRFISGQDLAPCHILFVSASEHSNQSEILKYVNRAPTLTVGETEDFAGAGGMVQFMIRDEMIRFRVNLLAAERAKLKISSQFLKLVQIVREKPTEENR